jgi:hypothetical protein
MDSFVVRVYRTGRDGLPEDDQLRGVVDEVSTGVQAAFQDAAELVAILRRVPPQRVQGGPDEQ